jgi:4-hydroxybenzoate polyprenyltransferase
MEGLALAPLALFAGSLFWTLGYDTIYAHQDKDDDALIGVRSTARLFGESTRYWVGAFYLLAWLLFAAAGCIGQLNWLFYPGLVLAGAQLAWQILRLDINDSALCLRLFRSNRDFGLLLFLSIVAGTLPIPGIQ